jgi:ketosteroid isomerase-like protein
MADALESPMIQGLNKQFVEAFKTRDFSAVAGMFTDDAVMLPPRSNIITGKSNIQSFWTRATRIREVKFDTDSLTALGGEVVREIGTFRMRVERPLAASPDQDNGGPGAAAGAVRGAEPRSREILGKYVFLWRSTNGEWKLETSIWNRNKPEGAGAGRRPRRRRASE